MTQLDKLYAIAEREDIDVFCFDLPHARCLAVEQEGGKCAIGIDPMYIETYEEEAELLAHELGHCMTGSFYNENSAADLRQKHERHADFWMVSHLLPPERLAYLLRHGLRETWQVAECLDVSERLVEKAFWIYRSKRLI